MKNDYTKIVSDWLLIIIAIFAFGLFQSFIIADDKQLIDSTSVSANK